jgi:hypothetical protein
MRHPRVGLDAKKENRKSEKNGKLPDISMKIVDF